MSPADREAKFVCGPSSVRTLHTGFIFIRFSAHHIACPDHVADFALSLPSLTRRTSCSSAMSTGQTSGCKHSSWRPTPGRLAVSEPNHQRRPFDECDRKSRK